MRAAPMYTFLVIAVTLMTSGLLQAQSRELPAVDDARVAAAPVQSSSRFTFVLSQQVSEPAVTTAARASAIFKMSPVAPLDTDPLFAQQPAGPPPTPRHTGIKAMSKHLVTNFKYLPSKENLLWAGAGGGLALAAHPFDDDVNRELVGNDTAENIFKTGEILRSEERRVGK